MLPVSVFNFHDAFVLGHYTSWNADYESEHTL